MDESNHDHGLPTERAPSPAGAVLDDAALDDLLQRVVVLARHTVAKANSVSITVTDNGRFRTSNSTSEEALAIDEAQYEGDGGPCLEAIRSSRQLQVTVADVADRWPQFEQKAREVGIATVLSTPLLPTAGDALGALNLYSGADGGFDESEVRSAQALGEHVAILVGNALALRGATHLNEQLRMALASREIIGEAKGIIMERQSCTRDEAFDILRRASQRENRKLRDLAEELVLRVEARRRDEASGT